MYRYRINLDKESDLAKFVGITTGLQGSIKISDGDGHCVNAKSVLGMAYAMTFDKLICESENDIYSHIRNFVAGDSEHIVNDFT